MQVVNENENKNENTYKNGEKTETTIQKTKTKTLIESKTELHVKTKIVQPTDLPYQLKTRIPFRSSKSILFSPALAIEQSLRFRKRNSH